MYRRLLMLLGTVLLCGACGSQTLDVGDNVPSGSQPVVIAVSPDSAPPGSEVHVRGFGYSVVPNENIIFVGETAAAAETYELLAEPEDGATEQLTFTIPEDAVAGEFNLFVTVLGEPSNADTLFTVTP